MKDNLVRLWEAVLERIATLVNPQSFQTWFKPTRLVSYEDGRLVIEGPNPFFVDWLAEHHREKILVAARETIGSDVSAVDFVSSAAPSRLDSPEASATRALVVNEPVTLPNNLHLNARYVFDEFIVGSSNQMAHAAAHAVAEQPALVYNPLFIYGGAGLGKTHLVQAIGHHVIASNRRLRISYATSEGFTNELIQAIRGGTTHEFKERYRSIDLLLIDDVQFLAGKESTQEEFFFTFNALHNANKQIVVTSDRAPKEIPGLEERLVSRFEWGLVTDIQPPDLETRIAILRKKVDKERIQIPDAVIMLIAENVKSNIRELEGSLVRILACSSLTRRDITLEMAQEVLRDIVRRGPQRKLGVPTVKKVVSQHFDVPIDSLKAKTRIARVVLARQVAMYIARKLTEHSLVEIGAFFGDRDHSTVLHACTKVSAAIETDPALKRKIQTIEEELLS